MNGVIIFWIIIGVVLAAIFAPGLLLTIGMWLMLIILPILGLLIKDLFAGGCAGEDSKNKENISNDRGDQSFGAAKKNFEASSELKAAKLNDTLNRSERELHKSRADVETLPKKRTVSVRRNNASNELLNDESVFEIRGLDKNNIPLVRLSQGFRCRLKRDPENSYDGNAIKVIDLDGGMVAYVAREKAAVLAPLMDKGMVYEVEIIPNTYQGRNWGVCFVRIVKEEKLDLRMTPRSEGGWILRLNKDDWEIVQEKESWYFIIACGELLTKNLNLFWNGSVARIGFRMTSEFYNRLREVLANKDSRSIPMELCFCLVYQLSMPYNVGGQDIQGEIRGIEFIKIDGIEIKTVKMPRLRKKMVYHMTALKNLSGIFGRGLLSNHSAHSQGLLKQDISERTIQSRRENKKVNGKSLHDYVSFYINPRNAMLYRVLKDNEVVVLGVKSESFEGEDYVLSDRNAAVKKAKFGNNQEFVDRLQWDTIFSDRWIENGIENRNVKEIMQSEVLVPNRVMPEKIAVVYCRNSMISSEVMELCKEEGLSINVECNPSLFYNR